MSWVVAGMVALHVAACGSPSVPVADEAPLAAEWRGTARCDACHAAPASAAPRLDLVREIEWLREGSLWDGFPGQRTLFDVRGQVFDFEWTFGPDEAAPSASRWHRSSRTGSLPAPALLRFRELAQALADSGYFGVRGRSRLDGCDDSRSVSIVLRLEDGTAREVASTCWPIDDPRDPHASFASLVERLETVLEQVEPD